MNGTEGSMEEDKDKTVTMPREMYESLYRASVKLRCLENGGVDNWKFYGEAMQPFYKIYEPDEEEEG